MMSSLRRDLFQRKLWPVFALLLVAVVAIPLLLRKSADAGVVAVAPPPALTGAATTAKQPPAGASAGAVPGGLRRDPFAGGSAAVGTQSGPTQPTASVTTPSSATTSTTTTSPSVVSPSPTAPSSGSGATPTPTPSSGSATTPTTTTTTTSSGSTTAPTTTTTVAGLPAATASRSWTVYRVSLRIGTGSFAPLRSDVVRLTPLPSVAEPKAMFMGVMAGGTEAVFALGVGVQHSGPGLCRPDRKRCAALVLRVGRTEDLIAPAAGGPRQFNLSLVSIAGRVTHSREEALTAFKRHSAVGLCELDLADPVTYSHGTVAAVAASVCKHHRAAVPFPGGLAAP